MNTYDFNFCVQCGSPLEYKAVGDEGSQKYCKKCSKFYFSEPSCCILAAIINEKNQVLLLKQNYISRDKYTLCSGYSQMGETLEETVCREVREETGYNVYKTEYVSGYYYTPKNLVMPGFIAYIMGEPVLFLKSKEVDEMRWADLDKAADMVLRVNNLSGVHLNNVIEKLTGKHILTGNVYTEYYAAFMDSHGKYNIAFDDDMIYDYSDVYDFEKAVERVIQPEVMYTRDFKKDNIFVRSCWDSFFGYWWEVIAKTEEEEKKVLRWADKACGEFMKQKNKKRD